MRRVVSQRIGLIGAQIPVLPHRRRIRLEDGWEPWREEVNIRAEGDRHGNAYLAFYSIFSAINGRALVGKQR